MEKAMNQSKIQKETMESDIEIAIKENKKLEVFKGEWNEGVKEKDAKKGQDHSTKRTI